MWVTKAAIINIRRGATQIFLPIAKKQNGRIFTPLLSLIIFFFLFYANISMEKRGKHKSMCSE